MFLAFFFCVMCQQFLYKGLAGLELSNGLAQSISILGGAQQMQGLLQAVVVLQRNHHDMFPTLTGDYRRFVIFAHRIQSLLKAGSRLTKSQDVHLFSLARCPARRVQAFYVHAPTEMTGATFSPSRV
ncbi:t-SNARE coiled-coil homology domain-containing protein [Burkholderia ambifaria]